MQYFGGNRALSLAHVQESERLLLQLEVIDKIGLADTRTLLSELMLYVEHDPIQLGQMLEENLKVYQAIGNQHDMARTLGRLSTLLHQTGDLEGARQACEQSVALFSACGDNIRATQESTALAILAIEEGRYADAKEQMERAALFYSQAPVNFAASVPLWLLGAIAIREREYERAKTFYTECVLFGQRTGELGQYKECFVGFAGIASAQDQLERAALLLGAAEARENTFYLEIFDRLEFERLVSELREKLGDKVFDTLAANGRVMTLDQAVAFALEKPRNKPHSGTVIFSSPVSKA
jgi:tetratricopeptide (TPR) repeat protein